MHVGKRALIAGIPVNHTEFSNFCWLFRRLFRTLTRCTVILHVFAVSFDFYWGSERCKDALFARKTSECDHATVLRVFVGPCYAECGMDPLFVHFRQRGRPRRLIDMFSTRLDVFMWSATTRNWPSLDFIVLFFR